MKIRGGSRIINNMLDKLGATPVGMPVPAVTEALSKGVISGTTIPWEVTPALKVSQLVKNHTTFAGTHGLYTQTFVFAKNKNAYEKLPADLKKVIDQNSGIEVAAMFGRAMDQGDVAGRAIAVKAGNNIVALDVNETQRWRRTAAAVETDWINEMKGKGVDGKRGPWWRDRGPLPRWRDDVWLSVDAGAPDPLLTKPHPSTRCPNGTWPAHRGARSRPARRRRAPGKDCRPRSFPALPGSTSAPPAGGHDPARRNGYAAYAARWASRRISA
jgi:hypothetical protein